MSMKNSNDTVGNRTHVLPGCSAVSEPTAPPRAPLRKGMLFKTDGIWILIEISSANYVLPLCYWPIDISFVRNSEYGSNVSHDV